MVEVLEANLASVLAMAGALAYAVKRLTDAIHKHIEHGEKMRASLENHFKTENAVLTDIKTTLAVIRDDMGEHHTKRRK